MKTVTFKKSKFHKLKNLYDNEANIQASKASSSKNALVSHKLTDNLKFPTKKLELEHLNKIALLLNSSSSQVSITGRDYCNRNDNKELTQITQNSFYSSILNDSLSVITGNDSSVNLDQLNHGKMYEKFEFSIKSEIFFNSMFKFINYVYDFIFLCNLNIFIRFD